MLLGFLTLAHGCQRGEAKREVAPSPSRLGLSLTDVAQRAGVRFRLGHQGKTPLNILETAGGGGAFVDYDNDGHLDILLVGPSNLALFHNNRDGTFADVTLKAFPRNTQYAIRNTLWMGCTTGDYDNDGFADLFVTGYHHCALFHNERNGTFRDVTQQAGVNVPGWSLSAAFGDVDNDGWLDLYVTRYVQFDRKTPQLCKVGNIVSACGPEAYEPQKGVLYRNQRNGTFQDVTRQAGVADSAGKGWGVVFSDYDNDGWQDFYVANDEMPCDLYRNLGKGKFENVGLATGTAYDAHGRLQGGMGCDFGDFNNDGRLDLFVTTYFEQPKSLYRNDGNGIFEEVSFTMGLAQKTLPFVAFGTALRDLNNDGFLDIFIANGHVRDNAHRLDSSATYAQRMQLFLSRHGEAFVECKGGASLPAQPIVGRGAAFGDYDNDGDIDILVVNLEGDALLLRNDGGNKRNWLRVKVRGRKGKEGEEGGSNRDGMGARVTITVGGKQRIAEVQTSGSVMSGNDKRVHFGLGNARTVERVEVRWLSGAKKVLENVKANQEVTIEEPPCSNDFGRR
jgi:hypothetical protein